MKRRRKRDLPHDVSRHLPHESPKDTPAFKMFLVPCSCGTTFAVAENYDRQGMVWSRYLPCPTCGKRHDPKNRLLQMGYQRDGYWTVDAC